MEKHSLVRTIYLYLFALIGLVLLTIGTVSFVDMGLKIFIFTKAEEPQRIRQEYKHFGTVPISIERIEKYQKGGELTEGELTEEEETAIKKWYQNYKQWQEAEAKIDYLTSQRHEDASKNLAFILIGLPLYLFHWRIIRKETKNKEKLGTLSEF